MRNESGLTLLEVVISMVVLSIGLIGLAPMVVLSIRGNTVSRDVQSVANIARDKIEFYKSLEPLPPLPFELVEQQGEYSITTVIDDSTVDSLLVDELCELQLTITWSDDFGVTHSSSYKTYLEKK